jgi:hypothetical protein
MANIAPYRLDTGIRQLADFQPGSAEGRTGIPGRMLRQITFTHYIAVSCQILGYLLYKKQFDKLDNHL